MTIQDKKPKTDGKSASRRKFYTVILLLLLAVLACVSSTFVPQWVVAAESQKLMPVHLHSVNEADYSVDPAAQQLPIISLRILEDILFDDDPMADDLVSRLATMTAILGEPISTATPSYYHSPTPTTTPYSTATVQPTDTMEPVLITTDTPTATQTAEQTQTQSSTRTNTATLIPTKYPTATPSPTRKPPSKWKPGGKETPLPGPSTEKTSIPTSTTTVTVSPTSTQTPWFTNTVTNTPEPLSITPTTNPTSTATETLIPFSTSTAMPTAPPTGTQTQTATPTATPTTTSNPSSTLTTTPMDTQTQTTTPTATLTDTPTQTATLTATPTDTQTLTPTLTATPAQTPTVPPCSSYPESGLTPSQDSWITFNNPDSSFPSDPVLRIHPNVNQLRRILIHFDLGSIPPESTITKATLFLNDEAGGEYIVQIHEITSSWIEAVSWLTQPTYDTFVRGSFPLTPSICVRSAYLDIAMVSAWVNDPASNYGILLESTTGNGEAHFSSRESTVPPRLVVEYVTP